MWQAMQYAHTHRQQWTAGGWTILTVRADVHIACSTVH